MLSRATARHDSHLCCPCRSDNHTTSTCTSAFVLDHAKVPLALGFIMSVLGRRGAIELRALTASSNLSASTLRPFSVLNRPPPNYPGHVPLTTIERGALAVGSAIGSLINPRRAGVWLLFFADPVYNLGSRSNKILYRSYCGLGRSYRDTIFHIPTTRCHAL